MVFPEQAPEFVENRKADSIGTASEPESRFPITKGHDPPVGSPPDQKRTPEPFAGSRILKFPAGCLLLLTRANKQTLELGFPECFQMAYLLWPIIFSKFPGILSFVADHQAMKVFGVIKPMQADILMFAPECPAKLERKTDEQGPALIPGRLDS